MMEDSVERFERPGDVIRIDDMRWWAVSPHGEKLDLTDRDYGPVAFFMFEEQAKRWSASMYPTTGEVHEVQRDVAERLEALWQEMQGRAA